MTEHAQGLYNYVADVPKPTIAAIDGYAFGGGTEIALACDIRVAIEGSRWDLPRPQSASRRPVGGTQRLAHVVGVGVAKE